MMGRIHCYRSWADLAEQERLWLFVSRTGGWMSLGLGWIDFWVPEKYSSLFCLMARLERRPDLDYLA